MNEFKIINPPLEPKKKFRRRKVYKVEEKICPIYTTDRIYKITITHYKNIVDIKYTPHI